MSSTVSQIANTSATAGSQTLSLSVTGLTGGEDYDFYFPLPVGTYDARTLKLQIIQKDGWSQDQVMLEQTIGKELKIKRNQLMELPALLYHRVYVKHNNPSAPYIYTEKPSSANTIRVNIANERLTAASYNSSEWKDGNRFGGATATYNLYNLNDKSGNYYLQNTGTYYLQYIVSADGSIPSELSDASVLAFGTVPFYYRAADDKVSVTSDMLNVPYVSTAEGAVANLVPILDNNFHNSCMQLVFISLRGCASF